MRRPLQDAPPEPRQRWSWRGLLCAGGCAWAVLLYLAEVQLVPGIPLTNAYLLPVAAVAWTVGVRGALVVAAVSTGLGAMASTGSVLTDVVLPAILNGGCAWTVGSLRNAYRRERRLARTDTVTGAPNRRAFEEGARATLRRHARTGRALTAVGIDLDGFKDVNDRLGHAEGDEVLRAVAATIARTVRSTDVVARYGGDEFAVILADTDETGAPALLARLHRALDGAMAERGWPVTFSIGAITFARLPSNERDLMRLVDAQMYAAKNAGKDRTLHTVHALAN
ncbi:MAG: GGDEF domain-containing protein [Myxococcota bacterium]